MCIRDRKERRRRRRSRRRSRRRRKEGEGGEKFKSLVFLLSCGRRVSCLLVVLFFLARQKLKLCGKYLLSALSLVSLKNVYVQGCRLFLSQCDKRI